MPRIVQSLLSPIELAARRGCIGGSDARKIMSGDPKAVEDLWLEKTGQAEPEDLSHVLVIAFGNALEDVNRHWFERTTGLVVTDEGKRFVHPEWPIATCTVDGMVESENAVFEAKFALPFHWSIEKSIEKHFAQCQHNMAVTGKSSIYLSVVTGGAQYAKVRLDADPFYQAALMEAERAFWRCVEEGRSPTPAKVEVPTVKLSELKVVDVSGLPCANKFAMHAADLIETDAAVKKHEKAKKALVALMPADAKEATGFGVKLTRTAKSIVTKIVAAKGPAQSEAA